MRSTKMVSRKLFLSLIITQLLLFSAIGNAIPELPTFPSKDRFILDKLVNHYLCGLVEGESEKDAKPDEKYETLVSEVSRQMVTAREELHRTPTSRLHLLGLNRLITEREDMIVNLATTKFDQLHKRFVMIRQLAQVNDVIEFEKRLVPRAQLVDDDEQQLARLLVFNEGTRVMDKSFEKVAQSLSGNCLHWSQFLEAKWRRYRVNPTSRSLFYLRETFDDLRKTALDISNRIPTLDDDLPPYIYRNATRVNLMSSKQVYKEIAKFFEQYLRYLHSGTGLSEPISKSINRCVSFDYPEETRRMALKVDNAFKIMDYVELKNENFTLGDSFHKDYLWHIQKARVDALEELESPLSISYDLLQKAPSKPLNVQADSYHARKIVTQLRETFEKVAIKLVGGCLFWSETLNNQWQKFRANQSSSSEVGNTFSVLKQLASQLNTQANQLHGHYNLSSLPVETQLMIVTACREFQRLESLFDDYLRRMQSKATIFNIFNSITPPNISHQCPNSQNAIKTEEYATKLSKAKSQFLAKHNDLIEKKLGDKIYDKISETTRNLDLSKLSNQIEDTNVDDFQSRYVLSEWLARMEALNELKDRCLGRVDFYRGQSVEYFKENKNLAQLKVELDQIKSKFDNTSQVRGCSQWAVVLGTDWLGHLVSGIGFDSDTLRANFQRVKTAALQAKEDVAKLWNPLSIQDGYILPETELELITTEKTYEKIAALLDTFLQRMNTPQKEISISTNKAMTEMCHPVQRDFQFVDTSEKLLQLQANFITTLDSCALGEYSTETTNQILVEIRNQLRAIHDQINVTLSQSNENQLHHQYTLRTIMTHIDSLSSMLRSKIASGLTCPNFQQTSGHGGNLLSSIYDYMHWFEKDAVDGLELESKCQPWSVVLDGRWQRHWQHSSEEQSLRYALGKLPREAWRRHGYLLNNRKREPCTWRNENLCINNNMIHAFDRFEFVFNGTTTQLAQTAQWSDEYVKRLDNSSYPDNNDNATPKVEETSAPQCPTFEPVTEKNLSSVNPDQLHKLYFVQLRLSRDEASKKLENLNITKEPLSVANDPKIGLSAVESAMASIDINFDKVARDIAHGCQHWTQVLESQWKNYQNKPDNSTSRVLLGEAFYKLEQSAQNAQERAGQLWSDVATKPYPRNLLLEFAAREVFYQNLSSLFEGFLKRVS